MVFDRRLLILSCSERKQPAPDLLPAQERYDGPAFRVLRRFLRERPDDSERLDVFILSAAYGLIPAEHLITEYDEIMTPQRATELHSEVLNTFANLIRAGYTELCLAMGRHYLRVLEGWSALVAPEVSVAIVDGPQGTRLAQLKRWLWGDGLETRGHRQRKVQCRGVARLRGVDLRLTPSEVLEQARVALVEDGAGADRFRDWYVSVDGCQVAPKWLVRVLTGLPVSAFTTGEARRVLCQLGLHARHISTYMEIPDDHQGA